MRIETPKEGAKGWYISGDPQPHPRPRATNMGKLGARIYQPKTKWQKLLEGYMHDLPELPFIEQPAPVCVRLHFYLSRPKSHYGTGRNSETLKPSAPKSPAVGRAGGDVDNLAKSVLDAMNGVAYDDDKQVVSLTTSKHYADHPRGPGLWIEIGEAA